MSRTRWDCSRNCSGAATRVEELRFVDDRGRENTRITDHRTNPPTITERTQATLHRFLPGGGYPGPIPFPEQYGNYPRFKSRGNTTAPLNVVKSGDIEAVVVPVSYKAPGGHDLRLIAFATDSGAILDDIRVTYVSDTITSSWDRCDIFIFSIGCSFEHGYYDELASITPPHPGAAISPSPAAVTPGCWFPTARPSWDTPSRRKENSPNGCEATTTRAGSHHRRSLSGWAHGDRYR